MDTFKTAEEVEAVIRTIKASMPKTYRAIQDKAEVIGRPAFNLVRQGIKGQPNCFWASENGHVVGTPFTHSQITRDVAQLMVTMGAGFVVIWAEQAVEGVTA